MVDRPKAWNSTIYNSANNLFLPLKLKYDNYKDCELINICNDLIDFTNGTSNFPQLSVDDVEELLEAIKIGILYGKERSATAYCDYKVALERVLSPWLNYSAVQPRKMKKFYWIGCTWISQKAWLIGRFPMTQAKVGKAANLYETDYVAWADQN